MVFCRGCGKEIHETAVSCPHCGAVQQVTVKSPKNQSGTLWLPVPSLILGVIVVLALFDESSWDKDTDCFNLLYYSILSHKLPDSETQATIAVSD